MQRVDFFEHDFYRREETANRSSPFDALVKFATNDSACVRGSRRHTDTESNEPARLCYAFTWTGFAIA